MMKKIISKIETTLSVYFKVNVKFKNWDYKLNPISPGENAKQVYVNNVPVRMAREFSKEKLDVLSTKEGYNKFIIELMEDFKKVVKK